MQRTARQSLQYIVHSHGQYNILLLLMLKLTKIDLTRGQDGCLQCEALYTPIYPVVSRWSEVPVLSPHVASRSHVVCGDQTPSVPVPICLTQTYFPFSVSINTLKCHLKSQGSMMYGCRNHHSYWPGLHSYIMTQFMNACLASCWYTCLPYICYMPLQVSEWVN